MSSALDTAVRFLGARPRSEAEVRRRLARGGAFSSDQIEATIAQLRRLGLLDDAAFAHYWLEQRQTHRPRGARLLQAELRQHGVASDLAVAATDTLSSPDEDAYRAAIKRARQLARAGADERTFQNRIGQHLARRGFDWETIATVVARLQSERI